MKEGLNFILQHNTDDFENVRSEIQRVVDDACHGEFDCDDVKQLIKRGRAYCAYTVKDGKTGLVCVWEGVDYPSGFSVANIMCLGGKNLKEDFEKYGEKLKQVMMAQGLSQIQCYSTPSALRLFRKVGVYLKQVYILSRGTL